MALILLVRNAVLSMWEFHMIIIFKKSNIFGFENETVISVWKLQIKIQRYYMCRKTIIWTLFSKFSS